MKKYLLLLSLLLITAPLMASISWGEATIEHIKGSEYELSIEAVIDDGWHIYDNIPREGGGMPTRLTLSLPVGAKAIGGLESDREAIVKFDDMLDIEVGYFEGECRFSQRLSLPKTPAEVGYELEWMLCSATSCSPPDTFSATVAVAERGSSMWLVVLEAILWGFAALLTPCIFPMIPMTISYFIKGEHSRAAALLYGVFIVALYTLPIAIIISLTYLFGGAAVTANIFNWVATHWLPNVLFFVVFLLFAASFFGLFEFKMPSSWVNRSDSKAGRSSVGGIFFLALTLVLVSFSCTGPIVGSVLIKSTSGDIWQPIITMLAFSVAFALPFVVISMIPSLLERMPRSGGWLSSVKIVLGFLELALALKFLSVADQSYRWGILNRDIYLVIWIVIFSLMGLYLIGKIQFKGEKQEGIGFVRLLMAIASFSFALYMLPGLWGAPLRPLSGYLPPLASQEFTMSSAAASVEGEHKFVNNLKGFYDIDEARAYAASVGKPLLIDFTGHGCVNCRNMEQRVWSDARVDELLREEYVIAALYMDDREELPASKWVTTADGRVLKRVGQRNAHYALERYGVNSQPYYILESADGELLAEPRGYDLSIDGYIDFLESGLARFK
ncbi:MAG: cytochrome c biogenesis protein CcdA, partial [Rikenellaceae bacterium]